MKEYTRTKKIKAIQWMGNNRNEIEASLGDIYYTREEFAPFGGNTLTIYTMGVTTLKIVGNSDWIVMDSSDFCGISVVSNEIFKKNLVL